MSDTANNPPGQDDTSPFTEAEQKVLGMLPLPQQKRVKAQGAAKVLKESGSRLWEPGLGFHGALVGLVARVHGGGSAETAEARRLFTEEHEARLRKNEDENFARSEDALKAMQERSEERAEETARKIQQADLRDGFAQEEEAGNGAGRKKSPVRWHYTAPQLRVLEMLSEEYRDYALEKGPFLLAREALDAEIRRGRYNPGGKSTSQLLFDVAEKRLAPDKEVRKAHVELFGTVSEHSTPESEEFLGQNTRVLGLLPSHVQKEILGDGTLTEVGRDTLGPYAYAELEGRGGTRRELERDLLAELVKKHIRDEKERHWALGLLGKAPATANGGSWQQESLEFGGEGGHWPLGTQAYPPVDHAPDEKPLNPSETAGQASLFALLDEAAKAAHKPLVPTREQSMGIGGIAVVSDLPNTPPAGPVVASPFADIVDKVHALSHADRAHLFEELYGLVPLDAVAKVLQDDSGPQEAVVSGLSSLARLQLFLRLWEKLTGRQIAEIFSSSDRQKSLAGALRRPDRIQLAYKLWSALEPAQRKTFLEDPNVRVALPERLQEALRVLYAFESAGVTIQTGGQEG